MRCQGPQINCLFANDASLCWAGCWGRLALRLLPLQFMDSLCLKPHFRVQETLPRERAKGDGTASHIHRLRNQEGRRAPSPHGSELG